MFNPYTKAVLGAMLVMMATLANAVEDGSQLTTSEIITAVGVGIAALGGVWAAHKAVKWLVSGLLAFLGALATAIEDGHGVSTQEWLTLAVATLTALTAIYVTPNTTASNKP